MEKEVLKSNNFVNYSTKDVVGKCWILQVKDYCRGRPKEATFENTFVCESRYNDQAKHISKIKNWSSAVPESVRGVEPNLELFDAPLVPVKVLSSIAESLVKKEAEEVSEPEPELEDEEEDDEDALEQIERRGRPRRSTTVVNPIGSTPVAPEKKVRFNILFSRLCYLLVQFDRKLQPFRLAHNYKWVQIHILVFPLTLLHFLTRQRLPYLGAVLVVLILQDRHPLVQLIKSIPCITINLVIFLETI